MGGVVARDPPGARPDHGAGAPPRFTLEFHE
jgi:hypothetical protein